MNKILIPGAFILLILCQPVFSQNDDVILGKEKVSSSAAFFDLSDPMGPNIDVNLWGFIKIPGRYRIPYNSTFMDLMSYCGGPTENSDLKEMRLFRPGNDSLKTKNKVIKINYEDLLYGEDIISTKFNNPVLKSGDIIVVMEEKRYSFRENLLIILPVVSSLLTITTLIVTLTKK